jgi:hypothetical protein
VGCALGKPVELFMGEHNGLSSKDRLKTYLTAISPDEYPLRDYVPRHSPAEQKTGPTSCIASTREQIAFMETDDDIRYTVLGQIALRQFGPAFCSSQVAHLWFSRLPYSFVCTAETQAYRNLVIGVDDVREAPSPEKARELDESIDWHQIVHHLNPYREWIGAQIRVDSYGYAAPGWPEKAAELAWRDARISHAKNGIYGAMFCAAMISAAFVLEDPMQIVETGLAEIPRRSRLHVEMRQVIDLCRAVDFRYERFEEVLDAIYRLLGHYNPVHTNNNAGLVVAAVLLGKHDFGKAISLAVMGGWDTDCNGATVGSIVGAMVGGQAAPAHWVGRLNDTLNSAIPGYHPIAISECAKRSTEIARKFLAME